MKNYFKWASGGAELMLGIPVVGGAFILATGWTPLAVMLVVHLIGLMIAYRTHTPKLGHSLGVAASILGVIPVVGMILHLTVGLVLILEAIQEEQKPKVIDGYAIEVEDVEPKEEQKKESV